MRRAFPILAAVAGLLLAASFAAGGVAPPVRHAGVERLATLATIGLHGVVLAYLVATGRRVGAMAGRPGWPEWVGAQAEKNRRKAWATGAPGVVLAIASGWGPAGGRGGAWQQALSAANLSFQIGAFLGEYAVLASQAKLLRDVGDWAGPAPQP